MRKEKHRLGSYLTVLCLRSEIRSKASDFSFCQCNLFHFQIVILVKGPFKSGGDNLTEETFVSAVMRNKQRLFLIALSFTQNSADAEDILQDVFLKLWKSKYSFEDSKHMDKWLTVVCVNESKNILKSIIRRKTNLITDEDSLYSFDTTSDYDLFKAVMLLPKNERTVTHLFYYEDLPIKEIAALLSISESAVKTRLNRARQHLKESLGDDWINE